MLYAKYISILKGMNILSRERGKEDVIKNISSFMRTTKRLLIEIYFQYMWEKKDKVRSEQWIVSEATYLKRVY